MAIESSCDETSAAIISNGKLLNNIVATQRIHERYGGVVPELASRAHQQHIIPVIAQCFKEANIPPATLSAVAYTQGPGLLGALLVGASFAKGMAVALNVPLIEVNHMQAHILAHFIEEPRPSFPFLCLTVSGGHTQLVLVQSPLEMEIVGQTQDDAVGEAFDKAAKMLGLPYPGGPELDKLAQSGNPERFHFAKTQMPGLDYSFSGIKTSILYFLREEKLKNAAFVEENQADLAASIQKALVDMLMQKLIKAAEQYEVKQIAIAGGVSANSALRARLQSLASEKAWEVFIPAFEYCTDNAGMIAMAAHFKFEAGQFASLDSTPNPRLSFTENFHQKF